MSEKSHQKSQPKPFVTLTKKEAATAAEALRYMMQNVDIAERYTAMCNLLDKFDCAGDTYGGSCDASPGSGTKKETH